MKKLGMFVAVVLLTLLARPGFGAGEDDKLGSILVPGEDWQVAVPNLGFADGLSTDGTTGGIFFSDMKGKDADKPGIYHLTGDLTKQFLFEGKFSGTRPSADRKTIYAIGDKTLVAFALPRGAKTVLAEKIGTNDLTVTRDGRVYFSGHGKGQVSLFDPKTKAVTAVDTGSIKTPNGIGLSPDQKTLIVSDYGGTHVWTFAVQPDGTLADKKSAMTMKASEKKPDVANGDGMAVDTDGRAYVTTALGVQVFAPTGELLGIIPKPKTASIMSATFGGSGLNYLYVSTGDTIYRRKVQTKGLVFVDGQ